MITFHASAVCRVRDGYTGRPMEPSALMCTLDEAPVRPLSKPGGYLILLDLSPGEHRLVPAQPRLPGGVGGVLRRRGHPGAGDHHEAGADYPFRGEVVRAELTVTRRGVPAAGRQLWLAAPGQWELKIAQTRAQAGEQRFRLYCRGPHSAVPAGPYLIADGADSEIVQLRAVEEETAELAAPLLRGHSRGRPLLSPSAITRIKGERSAPCSRPPVPWSSGGRRRGCWPACLWSGA